MWRPFQHWDYIGLPPVALVILEAQGSGVRGQGSGVKRIIKPVD